MPVNLYNQYYEYIRIDMIVNQDNFFPYLLPCYVLYGPQNGKIIQIEVIKFVPSGEFENFILFT